MARPPKCPRGCVPVAPLGALGLTLARGEEYVFRPVADAPLTARMLERLSDPQGFLIRYSGPERYAAFEDLTAAGHWGGIPRFLAPPAGPEYPRGMKRPKCPYGKLKVPIGRRVCKRKPGGTRPGRHAQSSGGSRHGPRAQPPYPQVGRLDRPEVNDLPHSRPIAVVDHRMLWDDGSAMDLPL